LGFGLGQSEPLLLEPVLLGEKLHLASKRTLLDTELLLIKPDLLFGEPGLLLGLLIRESTFRPEELHLLVERDDCLLALRLCLRELGTVGSEEGLE
jgi:hypothetical protein